MTVLRGDDASSALHRAAARATLAPSVHNTQPWRLYLAENQLDVVADLGRQLSVLDPVARQLIISGGCALFNARVSLCGSGFGADVQRVADSSRPELLASVTAVSDGVDPALAALDPCIELRQTNRRRFADDDVPNELLDRLEEAAAAERATIQVIRDPGQRATVARLNHLADDMENLNPAYRAELRAWTTDDPNRRDGVASTVVPRVDGSTLDELPMRDFDTRGRAGLPADTHSSREQCLVLLGTAQDSPAHWLRAGEALERVLLEITRHGYRASPFTQITEVPAVRARLQAELGLVWYPHVLLRIGRAADAPPSRRRRLVDVLVHERWQPTPSS